MSKRPSFQYYPADWRKDAAVQSCSIAARGLWHEMLCIAHECEPYGHLTVAGAAMTADQLARLAGLTPRECKALLAELEANAVFSRTDDGTIYSRRMVRDEALRTARAAGGEGGKEHGIKGAAHGSKGGRPRMETGVKKPPLVEADKPPLKPPPSSSSSSSSSAAQQDPLVAAGEAACCAALIDPARLTNDFAVVGRWLGAGYDLDRDILPAIRAVAAKPGYTARNSLNYFTQPIAEHHAARTSPVPLRPGNQAVPATPPPRRGIAIGSPEDLAERRAMGLEP